MPANLLLQDFRGVRKGTIEIAPLTILLGPNNSAKTTILEALFLLPNPFRDVPYLTLLPPQGQSSAALLLNELHGTLESQGFAFLMYNYVGTDGLIELVEDGKKYDLGLRKFSNNRFITFTTSVIPEGISPRVLPRGEGSFVGYGDVSLDNPSTGPQNTNTITWGKSLLITPRLLRNAFEYLRRNWPSITNLGVTNKVAEEASLISADKYDDFTIEPSFGGGLAINVFRRGLRIRLGDIGEGVQSYIVSRLLYEVTKPKLLLWDDLESHLNPRVLHRIAEWFGTLLSENRFIVVTTHSLEAAKILAGFNTKAAKIHLTYLDRGELKLRSYNFRQLEELTQKGIDLRVAEDVLL